MNNKYNCPMCGKAKWLDEYNLGFCGNTGKTYNALCLHCGADNTEHLNKLNKEES